MLIEPLPANAPAIVRWTAPPRPRAATVVAALLIELDRIARELFSAWLPEAADIDSAAGAGAAAVRSIALKAAQARGHFGPFLADLAERSLRRRAGLTGPYSPEVRAAELAKVIADAYGRHRTAILIRVDDEADQALAAAGRWLCDAGFGIWFTGWLPRTDAVEVVRFAAPVDVGEPLEDEPVSYPAIAGRPHPASRAEQLLEASLAPLAWAADREWNQTYQPHPLTNPIRVDLLWRAERLMVEIDGAEHCQPARFAADRQRDVLLQLDGYAVLRFTNHQVLTHRDLVLRQIEQFLAGRRAGAHKGVTHVGTEAVPAGTSTPAHSDGRKR
ncbi:DUF559 domain-containing protein [Dactylosporangium sp. NPDC005572]|uniref:endonuclease domain-containing protein n=1 Tax=Dactylosporangium sp. NPDC005572 TaxID=3156889 RepID=UPI0033B1ACAF